jgi:two-component system NtrC family sensor kinase
LFDFKKKFFLGVGAGVLLLLVTGLILGFYSLATMREVVSDQFNKQQLVLAEQAARKIESDFKIILQELTVLNQSPTVQYLEERDWSQRMKVTLAVIQTLGVLEIGRVSRDGARTYSVTREKRVHISPAATDAGKGARLWAGVPERKSKITITQNVSFPGTRSQGQVIMISLPTYLASTNQAHPLADQRYAGRLYGLLDVEQLVAQAVKGIRSGRTGYAWVIDQGGNFLYHPLTEFVGQNAFTVRARKGAPVSFDRINRLQKDRMLQGEQGTSWYLSGWHGGAKGEIKKLIAYAPIRLELPDNSLLGSVAVAAPVTEVDEAIQIVYTRQFLMQGVIIFAIILGGLLLLGFSWQYARTLQKEVEEKTSDWRQSEERYRKLVESAQDIIFTAGPEGEIFSLNQYGRDFLGGKLFQLDFSDKSLPTLKGDGHSIFRGRSLFDYFNPNGFFIPETLKEIWTEGRPKAVEHQVQIGVHECWLSTQLLAIKDDQGRTQAILGIARDISIRKRMEKQMINTEKLASLGFLSASIAHEINSPIGIILGYCDYLLEQVPPEEDVHTLLQKIEQQGIRCKNIIDHLLGFARYSETGEEFADVNQELDKVLQVTGKVLMEKKIQAVKKYETPLPAVKADGTPLQQVFLNLVNNAIAAMSGGGSLTLETRWDVYKDKVRVIIRDTGTGIKPEYRDHVFEPFFTTKKAGEGTGLGLSVCENIVRTYGGTISLESKTEQEDPEHRGTTITVSLPVQHSGRI